MSPGSMLHCSRCGTENRPQRLFCEVCGLGLAVIGPADAAKDAPVGALYAQGLKGLFLGLLLCAAGLLGLLQVLRTRPDLVESARVLQLYYTVAVPLLLALTASFTLVRAGRQLGLPARPRFAALGAVLTTVCGLAAGSWAGFAAPLAGILLSPLGAARAGLGLFQAWSPAGRLVLLASAFSLVSVGLGFRGNPVDGPIFLVRRGPTILASKAGTAIRFRGLETPVRQTRIPAEVIGLFLQEGKESALLRSGARLDLFDTSSQPQTFLPPDSWTHGLRLDDRLVLVSSTRVFLTPRPQGSGLLQMLWNSPRESPRGAKLGALGRTVLVSLQGGRLLEIQETGLSRILPAAVPPSMDSVTLDGPGHLVCGLSGRNLLCRELPGSDWTPRLEGLPPAVRPTGLCALPKALVIATDRGLFLGSGTVELPFRRVAASPFEAVEATETGALASGQSGIYDLDQAGAIERLVTSFP